MGKYRRIHACFLAGINACLCFRTYIKRHAVSTAAIRPSFAGLITIPFFETWGLELTEGTFIYTISDFISRMNIFNAVLGGNWVVFNDAVTHLILPALALSTIPMALIARMTRSSMLDVLGQDYIRTARAKGLSQPCCYFETCVSQCLITIGNRDRIIFRRLAGRRSINRNRFQFIRGWPHSI